MSLKLEVQQLGAYTQSRARLPQRWHGVWPLHLIFRRLHSLLQRVRWMLMFMCQVWGVDVPCYRDVAVALLLLLLLRIVALPLPRVATTAIVG